MKNANQYRNRRQLEELRAQGIAVKSLDNAPEVMPEFAIYYRMFELLSGRRLRTDSGRPQPIQLSELQALCRLLGVKDQSEVEDAIYYTTILDNVFLEHAARKAPRR